MFHGDITWVGVSNGMCWDDSELFNDAEVGMIAKCAQDVFNTYTDATFMWTARTEIEQRWSYIDSYDRKWLE